MPSLQHLSVSYHKPVLTDITMDFEQKIYGIQGESGSGKSTLIKAILGLIPYSGRVLYNGKELKKPKDRHGFQVIFQNPFYSFNPQKTIRSAFVEMLRWHPPANEQALESPQNEHICRTTSPGGVAERLSRRYFHNRTAFSRQAAVLSRYLEPTGLPESVLDKYPSAFSGGELQRLAVARALAGNPQVLILDEPTSALDVITQKKLLDDMLPLLKGKTVLLISHDTRVINYCTDEMITLQNQRLVR